MSLLGIVVAMAAAAGWAGFDATRKTLVLRVDPTLAATWVNLLQGLLFVGWALATRGLWARDGYWAIGAAVLGLQVLANLMLFRALRVAPLSVTIPFLSLTPAFASLVGLAVLGEHPRPLQWFGIVIVVVGALSIHGRDPWRAFAGGQGSWLAAGVALIWSVTSVLDKLALQETSLALHAAVQSGGVGLLLALALVARRRSLRISALALPPLAGAVLLGTAALALQLWAIQLLFVGIVDTIKRAIGMVSAVLLGRWLFDEPITRRKLVAVAMLVAGTALLVGR